MAITLDGTNGILSPDFEPSSSTTPTNGLFLPAANTVGLATGSTERLRIDSSGNLGLGVTPSGWSGLTAFELSAAGSQNFSMYGGGILRNAYYNGSNWIYKASAAATLYEHSAGSHRWYNAPSGTAGNAISFTQAMTLDASGRLLVGATSNPNGRRVLVNGTGSGSTWISITDTAQTSNEVLIGQDPTSSIAYFISSVFGIGFSIGGVERARIDTSGNLLVGQTSASYTTLGASIRANGAVNSASASDFWNAYSTAAGAYRFYVTNAGTVYATNTTIAAISDQRLKENIRDLDDGLATILALKPRKFDWKEGKGKDIKDDRGFIAQEFEQVFPDLVDTWKDEPPEGEEPYKAVRPDLIPVLVKAIQELTARLEALEAK